MKIAYTSLDGVKELRDTSCSAFRRRRRFDAISGRLLARVVSCRVQEKRDKKKPSQTRTSPNTEQSRHTAGERKKKFAAWRSITWKRMFMFIELSLCVRLRSFRVPKAFRFVNFLRHGKHFLAFPFAPSMMKRNFAVRALSIRISIWEHFFNSSGTDWH